MQKSSASKEELNETAELLRQAIARAEAAELQVEEGKIAFAELQDASAEKLQSIAQNLMDA